MQRLIHLLLLSLLVLALSAPVVQAQNEHLVLAFYYAWFDAATWSGGRTSDQPAQPYDSRDRATIERHVAQAKSAGIDGLVHHGQPGGVAGDEPDRGRGRGCGPRAGSTERSWSS